MGVMGWMRRTSKYFLIAVVVAFVASLAYFGAGQDQGTAQEWLVRVNGEAIPAAAYERTHRALVEQYRQAFQGRLTDEMLRSLRLQDQVVERLTTERLLAQRAAAEGIQVTDAELAAQITRMPAFQDQGRFSRDRYLQLLTRARLTPTQFEADLRAELLRQKLQSLITDGTKVTEAETRLAWEVEQQKVRVAYLLVTPEAAESLPVADAELTAYHAAHPAEFTPPERRRALMALLPSAAAPPPPVTDADIEAAFKERRAQFETPTRVRLAHVLVRVPTTGGSQAEDQARAKAEAALQRVRGGADFAQVAREVSEDPGTAARGGELGLVAPGELAGELDRAIFTLKKDEVAGPIRSPFGFHVVKALEVQPGSKKELKDAAPTLRATLQAEGALRLLREKATDAQRNLLGAADFVAEAKTLGLTVREIGPLAKSDPVEGVGRVAEATEALFALAPDGVSPPVKVPEGYAIFRLVEVQPSALRPLAEVQADVTRAVRRQKAAEAAVTRARQLAEAIRKGEDIGAVARQAGLAVGEAGPFSKAAPLADRDLAAAIAGPALWLPDGGVAGPLASPRGQYVVKLLARERADAAAFAAARKDAETRLLQQKRAQAWQAWLSAARAQATIEVNRRILPEAGPTAGG